ncbi:hypothetical protein HXX76_012670 [Chlamydomonas incerta]|uniref:Cyclic nucleotide-binding domain-containing protein n=1 Tax=Chlamydomonas incerta TaxID=51695 RepID=A0A835VV08_CHLIN|nr:hypothetical protein HXX76_012670 [Chlamydomonas incerta]|eukprot:KAG2426883.1 hypothetical protein HXX76_012670 [Chlamydomonas incerta]
MAEGAFLLGTLYEKTEFLLSAPRRDEAHDAAALRADAPNAQLRVEPGGQGHTDPLSWQPKGKLNAHRTSAITSAAALQDFLLQTAPEPVAGPALAPTSSGALAGAPSHRRLVAAPSTRLRRGASRRLDPLHPATSVGLEPLDDDEGGTESGGGGAPLLDSRPSRGASTRATTLGISATHAAAAATGMGRAASHLSASLPGMVGVATAAPGLPQPGLPGLLQPLPTHVSVGRGSGRPATTDGMLGIGGAGGMTQAALLAELLEPASTSLSPGKLRELQRRPSARPSRRSGGGSAPAGTDGGGALERALVSSTSLGEAETQEALAALLASMDAGLGPDAGWVAPKALHQQTPGGSHSGAGGQLLMTTGSGSGSGSGFGFGLASGTGMGVAGGQGRRRPLRQPSRLAPQPPAGPPLQLGAGADVAAGGAFEQQAQAQAPKRLPLGTGRGAGPGADDVPATRPAADGAVSPHSAALEPAVATMRGGAGGMRRAEPGSSATAAPGAAPAPAAANGAAGVKPAPAWGTWFKRGVAVHPGAGEPRAQDRLAGRKPVSAWQPPPPPTTAAEGSGSGRRMGTSGSVRRRRQWPALKSCCGGEAATTTLDPDQPAAKWQESVGRRSSQSFGSSHHHLHRQHLRRPWHSFLLDAVKVLDGWLPMWTPSPGRSAWDVLVLLLLLFTAVEVPLEAGFPDQMGHIAGLAATHVAVLVVFWIDIVVQFRTAYVSDSGELVRDSGAVAAQYARTWLAPDLLSSLPWAEILKLILGAHRPGVGVLASLLRLPRLLRLMRLVRQLDRSRYANAVRMGRLLVLVLLVSHWTACAWHGLATWLDDWPWLFRVSGLRAADPLITQYSYSIYYSLVLVVGGDNLQANNNLERVFMIVLLVAGSILYALVVSNMAFLVANFNSLSSRYKSKAALAADALRYIGAPEQQRQRVAEYYDFLISHDHPGPEADGFINELPRGLVEDIKWALYAAALHGLPLFGGCSEPFMAALQSRLTLAAYTPGEVIYRALDVGRDMCIMRRGCVALLHAGSGDMAELLSPGDAFGELALLPDLAARRRMHTAVVLQPTDVVVLAARDVAAVCKDHPDGGAVVQERLHQRYASVLAGGPPAAYIYPDFLFAIGACDDELAAGGNVVQDWFQAGGQQLRLSEAQLAALSSAAAAAAEAEAAEEEEGEEDGEGKEGAAGGRAGQGQADDGEEEGGEEEGGEEEGEEEEEVDDSEAALLAALEAGSPQRSPFADPAAAGLVQRAGSSVSSWASYLEVAEGAGGGARNGLGRGRVGSGTAAGAGGVGAFGASSERGSAGIGSLGIGVGLRAPIVPKSRQPSLRRAKAAAGLLPPGAAPSTVLEGSVEGLDFEAGAEAPAVEVAGAVAAAQPGKAAKAADAGPDAAAAPTASSLTPSSSLSSLDLDPAAASPTARAPAALLDSADLSRAGASSAGGGAGDAAGAGVGSFGGPSRLQHADVASTVVTAALEGAASCKASVHARNSGSGATNSHGVTDLLMSTAGSALAEFAGMRPPSAAAAAPPPLASAAAAVHAGLPAGTVPPEQETEQEAPRQGQAQQQPAQQAPKQLGPLARKGAPAAPAAGAAAAGPPAAPAPGVGAAAVLRQLTAGTGSIGGDSSGSNALGLAEPGGPAAAAGQGRGRGKGRAGVLPAPPAAPLPPAPPPLPPGAAKQVASAQAPRAAAGAEVRGGAGGGGGSATGPTPAVQQRARNAPARPAPAAAHNPYLLPTPGAVAAATATARARNARSSGAAAATAAAAPAPDAAAAAAAAAVLAVSGPSVIGTPSARSLHTPTSTGQGMQMHMLLDSAASSAAAVPGSAAVGGSPSGGTATGSAPIASGGSIRMLRRLASSLIRRFNGSVSAAAAAAADPDDSSGAADADAGAAGGAAGAGSAGGAAGVGGLRASSNLPTPGSSAAATGTGHGGGGGGGGGGGVHAIIRVANRLHSFNQDSPGSGTGSPLAGTSTRQRPAAVSYGPASQRHLALTTGDGAAAAAAAAAASPSAGGHSRRHSSTGSRPTSHHELPDWAIAGRSSTGGGGGGGGRAASSAAPSDKLSVGRGSASGGGSGILSTAPEWLVARASLRASRASRASRGPWHAGGGGGGGAETWHVTSTAPGGPVSAVGAVAGDTPAVANALQTLAVALGLGAGGAAAAGAVGGSSGSNVGVSGGASAGAGSTAAAALELLLLQPGQKELLLALADVVVRRFGADAVPAAREATRAAAVEGAAQVEARLGKSLRTAAGSLITIEQSLARLDAMAAAAKRRLAAIELAAVEAAGDGVLAPNLLGVLDTDNSDGIAAALERLRAAAESNANDSRQMAAAPPPPAAASSPGVTATAAAAISTVPARQLGAGGSMPKVPSLQSLSALAGEDGSVHGGHGAAARLSGFGGPAARASGSSDGGTAAAAAAAAAAAVAAASGSGTPPGTSRGLAGFLPFARRSQRHSQSSGLSEAALSAANASGGGGGSGGAGASTGASASGAGGEPSPWQTAHAAAGAGPGLLERSRSLLRRSSLTVHTLADAAAGMPPQRVSERALAVAVAGAAAASRPGSENGSPRAAYSTAAVRRQSLGQVQALLMMSASSTGGLEATAAGGGAAAAAGGGGLDSALLAARPTSGRASRRSSMELLLAAAAAAASEGGSRRGSGAGGGTESDGAGPRRTGSGAAAAAAAMAEVGVGLGRRSSMRLGRSRSLLGRRSSTVQLGDAPVGGLDAAPASQAAAVAAAEEGAGTVSMSSTDGAAAAAAGAVRAAEGELTHAVHPQHPRRPQRSLTAAAEALGAAGARGSSTGDGSGLPVGRLTFGGGLVAPTLRSAVLNDNITGLGGKGAGGGGAAAGGGAGGGGGFRQSALLPSQRPGARRAPVKTGSGAIMAGGSGAGDGSSYFAASGRGSTDGGGVEESGASVTGGGGRRGAPFRRASTSSALQVASRAASISAAQAGLPTINAVAAATAAAVAAAAAAAAGAGPTQKRSQPQVESLGVDVAELRQPSRTAAARKARRGEAAAAAAAAAVAAEIDAEIEAEW